MKISVIGSGYVGTTTAAILANCGHNVTVVEIDEAKVEKVNSGQSPFFEAGVAELIKSGIDSNTLKATSSYEEGISGAEVVFSCVGTPDKPDGSSNLDYVFAAAKSAAQFMEEGAIFVQKSTVPVGTGKQVIEHIAKYTEKNINYTSNPEFLREGTAVYDTLMFDRVVVGGDNASAIEKILKVYRSIEDSKQSINEISGVGVPKAELTSHEGQYVATSLQSAELTKLAANSFLALKISFANSIAKLADKSGADIVEVMDAVGSDKRIGRAFLHAGHGYGGGCFPKDVSGLIMSADEHHADSSILTSADKLNSTMARYVVDKLEQEVEELKGKKIALLGLAFKPNTSDVRKSPAIKVANILASEGAKVTAFDPEAMTEAKEDLSKTIVLAKTAQEAITGADILVVSTPWDEFKRLNLDTIKEQMNGDVFLDNMNAFDKKKVTDARFKYIGVGR